VRTAEGHSVQVQSQSAVGNDSGHSINEACGGLRFSSLHPTGSTSVQIQWLCDLCHDKPQPDPASAHLSLALVTPAVSHNNKGFTNLHRFKFLLWPRSSTRPGQYYQVSTCIVVYGHHRHYCSNGLNFLVFFPSRSKYNICLDSALVQA
jgi:hypothetical protein